MDLVYNSLPDVFSNTSMRHMSYDTPWLSDTSTTGRFYGGNKKPKEKCSDGKGGKDSCPICQERQRRPLATYIRSKSRQDRKEDSSIKEEFEGAEERDSTEENNDSHEKK
ncbi:uncharacterized protein fok [Anabrus simplex]|uniref:uncharacterized protein fok n=1 Tax=Anabrus simplex TaxID=316456 RepID=UPI0034DD6805